MGDFPLLGSYKHAWGIGEEDDLLAIKSRAPPDVFSRWFTEHLIPRYDHVFRKNSQVIQVNTCI